MQREAQKTKRNTTKTGTVLAALARIPLVLSPLQPLNGRQQRFLVVAFIVLVFGVGLTQATIELTRGERPQVLNLFTQAPTEANLRAFEAELEDASWFAQRLRPWMQYVHFAVLEDAGEKGLWGREGWLFYKPGVQYLVEPCPDMAQVVSAVVSFREQLAARGIHLLVVPAPGKASVYPDMLTRRAANAGPLAHGHTQALMAELREGGVEVVDLPEAFREARRAQKAQEGAPLYLAQDTHWSPAGMGLAAETVAARLLELGWVEKGPVAYDSRPAPLIRRGDVLEMMRAPRIARRYAPEQVVCTQVVRRDTGAVYADDPESEVLVLGDSFLRIYQRDEPGSAGFIAHLARALGFPVASIVNDGGASTLVRQELYGKPGLLMNKKVVIWEFVERDVRFGTEGWQGVPLPDAV